MKIIDYTYSIVDHFEEFIIKLCKFSLKSTSNLDIDTSPNNLISGSVGDIIIKNKNIIQYKSITNNTFINISEKFPDLTKKTERILSIGTNKYATWTYTINGWKLEGYICKELNTNCCLTNSNNLSLKSIPTIIWNTPDAITYGDVLTNEQLNAHSDIDGTFKYEPDFGETLLGGQHTLKVYFTPNNTESYSTVTSSVQINVNKVLSNNPQYSLIWNTPNPITYGDLLSNIQLNAKTFYRYHEVYGKYIYVPNTDAKLSGGTHNLNVAFIPDASNNFDNLTHSVQLEVNKKNPTIIWPEIGEFYYGTPLSENELNAYVSDNITGTFIYNYNIGYELGIGSHTLIASFIPDDEYLKNYTTGSASNVIEILLGYTLEWDGLSPIISGDLIPANEYPTAINGNDEEVVGTFQYYYSTNGGVSFTEFDISLFTLPAGNLILKTTFTPSDSYYKEKSVSTTLLVIKNPNYIITWNPNTTIIYGNKFNEIDHLNAVCDISGSFSYNVSINDFATYPSQNVILTFTPDDINYDTKQLPIEFTVVQNDVYDIIWNPIGTELNQGISLTSEHLNAFISYNGSTITDKGEFKYYRLVPDSNPVEIRVGSKLPSGYNQLFCVFIPTDNGYAEKSTVNTPLSFVIVYSPGRYYLRFISSGVINHILGSDGSIHINILDNTPIEINLSSVNTAVVGDSITIITSVSPLVIAGTTCKINSHENESFIMTDNSLTSEILASSGTILKLLCVGTTENKQWLVTQLPYVI